MLLKKLYVKKSLQRTENGIQLRLKNVLAPGTIPEFLSVEVDGRQCPLDKVFVEKKHSSRPAEEVNPKAPLTLPLNEAITLKIEGVQLKPGFHKVLITVRSKEVGVFQIPIEDVI